MVIVAAYPHLLRDLSDRRRTRRQADTAATGDVEARIEAQDATSSIQTGISCVDPRGAASRLHLAAAPALRSITSWIRTDLPNHGCQRYATIASPAEIAKNSGLWVLWRGVVQPPAAPLQHRIPNSGTGEDGHDAQNGGLIQQASGPGSGGKVTSLTVATPDQSCEPHSRARAIGPSRSSSARTRQKASRSSRAAGSWSGHSPGSVDAADWRRTGKHPSKLQLHGPSSPASRS